MFVRTRRYATVGLLSLWAFSAASSFGQTVKKGQAFPEFSEPDMRSGKSVSLKQLRGKVVLIDYWATWCGPCKRELPNVKDAFEKFHKKGLEIVSVSLDQNIEVCKSFVEREKLDWYHVCDGKFWDAKLAKKHQIHSIPATYIIGKDGKVADLDVTGPALHKAIEAALKAGGGSAGDDDVDDDVEKEARKALAKADAQKADAKYAEALDAYDRIAVEYAGRPAARTATERARELREDPAVMKSVEKSKGTAKAGPAESSDKAAKLLVLARSMRDTKKYDQARSYYQQIIDKYGDSAQANTAKAELDKLPK